MLNIIKQCTMIINIYNVFWGQFPLCPLHLMAHVPHVPWALHASVFGLKRFFCQIQCIHWAECLPFSHLT